jgi:hypothetical protein
MKLFSEIRGNCTKKNPAICRIHGKKYREQRDFLAQVREREKELAFKAVTEPDFQASWTLREEKDGTTSVAVYRSGVPSAPAVRGVENGHYSRADAEKPAGYQGRMNGIFAAPTLGGVCRWVQGNYMTHIPDVKVREMRVDVDSTYVYSINKWEKASSHDTTEAYQAYWKTGISMREYMMKAQANPTAYNPTEWELLIPESSIRSVKTVGASRVAERSYSKYDIATIKGILQDKPPHLWK